jgi:hypothetical protein
LPKSADLALEPQRAPREQHATHLGGNEQVPPEFQETRAALPSFVATIAEWSNTTKAERERRRRSRAAFR